MNTNQKDVFLSSEGDSWYERNKCALEQRRELHEIPLSIILDVLPENGSLLEIGCSDGSNLRSLAQKKEFYGHGIDPSKIAVSGGGNCRQK